MAQKYRVLLPKTKFPLRTNPTTSDPSIRAAASFDQLYKWQQENRDPDKTFVLHDGPPYANGAPHMGHALNKILKDILNRYKLLRGYKIDYRPGWDCHGLPIELKACRDDDVVGDSAVEIRAKAAQFAKSAVKQQKEVFRRWGLLGDWDNTYLTMHRMYERSQIGVFYEMYKRGCIYQGFKPVYWSPSSSTALAEAELEYKDHVSRSVYTLFPLISKGSLDVGGSGEIFALVWTTTPWTLVANKAICYHPEHTYSLVELRTNMSRKLVLVGSKCLEKLVSVLGDYKLIDSLSGSHLEGLLYRNPIDKSMEARPFLPALHVSDDEGTGLVHTAPAHGYEDFSIGSKYDLNLKCVVDGKGRYLEEVGAEFCGLDVMNEGNDVVLSKLRSTNALVHEHSYTHRYPYDWRTKKPVIIRATEQWFASVSSLKEQAKNAIINDVTMYPPSSRNRILPMLDGRDDWCISRQRIWGVPLPIFYHRVTGKPLITDSTISRIKYLISRHGSDCWWTLSVKELLPILMQSVAHDYTKGEDTMDVWFDSGSSWASVLQDSRGGDGGGVADVYLEGLDQHRGWFQSSLLTSVAVQNRAPYKVLVTHGFVLDKAGDKMSKSVGNVLNPEDILDAKGFGTDVMRLWVGSSDNSQDVPVSDEILKQNSDLLQKIRVTCRFMLGNLSDFTPCEDGVRYSRLSKLDRYILHVLSDYISKAMISYDTMKFSNFCHSLVTFIPNDLSSFYFDIIKDTLYCEGKASRKRRSTQTALYHLLRTLVQSVAPVLPHLAEEVYQHPPLEGQVSENGVTQ